MTARHASYAAFSDAVDAAWEPTRAALAAAGIATSIEHIGGGCVVLQVPLSEDGTRWAWIGTDDDPDEPLWIDDRGPLRWLSGCAYVSASGDYAFAGLDDPHGAAGVGSIDIGGRDVVDAIRELLRTLMSIPASAYQAA